MSKASSKQFQVNFVFNYLMDLKVHLQSFGIQSVVLDKDTIRNDIARFFVNTHLEIFTYEQFTEHHAFAFDGFFTFELKKEQRTKNEQLLRDAYQFLTDAMRCKASFFSNASESYRRQYNSAVSEYRALNPGVALPHLFEEYNEQGVNELKQSIEKLLNIQVIRSK